MAGTEKPRRGECFVNAHRLFEDLTYRPTKRRLHDDRYLLCHGTPVGPAGVPHAGFRFWHAWVEHEQIIDLPAAVAGGTVDPLDPFVVDVPDHRIGITSCIDFVFDDDGNPARVDLPAALYYRAGQLTTEHVWRYDRHQVAAKHAEWGTYGPWVPAWERIAR